MSVDPSAVILSYSRDSVPPRWALRLMRPVGKPFFAVLLAAGLWVLWVARVPETRLASGQYFLWHLGLGIYLILRLFLGLVLRGIYRDFSKAKSEFIGWVLRVAVAALFALGIWSVALKTDWPVRLAFRLSEPAMRRDAEMIIAAEAKTPPTSWPIVGVPASYPSSWVGLFRTKRVSYRRADGAVVFFVGEGDMAEIGWTYSPKVKPKASPHLGISFEPYVGDWYLARQSDVIF